MGNLRDAGKLLVPAVAETIAALKLTPADVAATRLAMQYAEAIDQAHHSEHLAEIALAEIDPEDLTARLYIQRLNAALETKELLDKLGPKLLAVVESLGATPAARAKLKGGQPADDGDPLSRLPVRRRGA